MFAQFNVIQSESMDTPYATVYESAHAGVSSSRYTTAQVDRFIDVQTEFRYEAYHHFHHPSIQVAKDDIRQYQEWKVTSFGLNQNPEYDTFHVAYDVAYLELWNLPDGCDEFHNGIQAFQSHAFIVFSDLSKNNCHSVLPCEGSEVCANFSTYFSRFVILRSSSALVFPMFRIYVLAKIRCLFAKVPKALLHVLAV